MVIDILFKYIHNYVEWDRKKAEVNLQKHGISFEEAASVIFDSRVLCGEICEYPTNEDRLLAIGKSQTDKLLVLIYTIRRKAGGSTKIRIISARKANRKERKMYEIQTN